MSKEFSMTPDAIRKREKRAQAKAAQVITVERTDEQINISAANAPETAQNVPEHVATQLVEVALEQSAIAMSVLFVGHAFVKGKGKDAKPKKDSIWGVMQADAQYVKFFGRVGGALRFKVADSLDEAKDLYGQKLAGTDAKKLKHVDLAPSKQAELLGNDWPSSLFAKYAEALKKGAVDQR